MLKYNIVSREMLEDAKPSLLVTDTKILTGTEQISGLNL
jgi:hypothetical protein